MPNPRHLQTIVTFVLVVSCLSLRLPAGELEYETQRMMPVLARGDQIDEILRRIAQIGPESSSAQDSLFQLLKNDVWQTAAAEALVAMNLEAMPTLRKALRQDDLSIRTAIAEALAGMGRDAEPLVPDLIKLLESEIPRVRSAGIAALGELRLDSPIILSALQKCLLSDDADDVGQAAASLAKIGRNAKQVVPTLTTVARTHDDPAIRYAAIDALVAVGVPDDVVPVLTHALRDPGIITGFVSSASVQEIAIEGLAKLAHAAPQSVPALLEYMKECHDPREWIRPCAILGEAANATAIPFLKQAIERPDPKDAVRQYFPFSPPDYDFTVILPCVECALWPHWLGWMLETENGLRS